MSDKLEAYLSFLEPASQAVIDDVRMGAVAPYTVLSILHWVAHQPSVTDKLSMLIVKELQDILNRFQPNREGISSMASLTMRPDKCKAECFGSWEDYDRILTKVPYLEAVLGKRISVIPKDADHNKQQVFNYITGAKVDGS